MREIERICKGRRVSPDYYSEHQALEEWAKLTSVQAMTMDLLRFLRDEAKLRPKDEVAAWQVTLTELFNLELRIGFPLSALPSGGFRKAEWRSRNAEESLLVALYSCFTRTDIRTSPNWVDSAAAGSLIQRIRGQLTWSESPVIREVICALLMTGQRISFHDLVHANLSGADLRDTSMSSTVLNGARLSGAQLCRVRAHRAWFHRAQLTKSDLTGADLEGADLTAADLTGADLTEANLSNADLTGADLTGADLTGADLAGAILSEADLTGVKSLTREQIKSARDVSGAKLPDYLKQAGPRSRTRRAGGKPTPIRLET